MLQGEVRRHKQRLLEIHVKGQAKGQAEGQTWALIGCHQDQLAGGMAALRCLVLCSSTMKVPSSSSRHICCRTTSLGAHICSATPITVLMYS